MTELIEFANNILNWFLKGLKEYSEWLKLFNILTLQARDIIFSKVAATSKNLDIKANTKKKPTKIKKFAIPLKSLLWGGEGNIPWNFNFTVQFLIFSLPCITCSKKSWGGGIRCYFKFLFVNLRKNAYVCFEKGEGGGPGGLPVVRACIM